MHQEYLVSNEIDYLHVISHIQSFSEHGRIYIGTGPDQNYTYIAALRPSYAFIVDYRRDNQLLHFLFKALFEIAGTRQEYLSLLFCKPLDEDMINDHPSLDRLIGYFTRVEGDERIYRNNLSRLLNCLQKYRRVFPSNDLRVIEAMYARFFADHLNLRCRSDLTTWHGWPYPNFRNFLLAKDQYGRSLSFLNDDTAFAFVKEMHRKNLIIPITGDFSGPKTLKTLASFITDRSKVLSAFYLSNVEYHLFKQNLFDAFVSNVRLLPVDERSLFIRTFVNTPSQRHPESRDGQIFTSVVQPIRSFLRLYDEKRYQTYRDIGTLDYIH